MIHFNGMAGLGDGSTDSPSDPENAYAGQIPGTDLPSSELLLASDWGTSTAPTLPPASKTGTRSYAKPPASPSELANVMFGPPVPSNLADGFPPPTSGGETLFGVIPLPSWLPKWAAYGGLLVAAAFATDYGLRHFGGRGGRRLVTNPKGRRAKVVGGDDDRDLVERARDFGEKFRWGIPGRKVRRAKVPKAPKVMTKLGEIVNITYKTKKRGESAEYFVHEFGEEGGKRPTLGMDIENKKLHFVGGDYDVTADGIKD